uniref:Uncharacterized protein n=1 Tax=Panagrolaimus sp. ES5 TaxID=591445 RepID=A0AC34G239_9BILA
MIVKYNQRKETIESLLDAGKEKSVFTESLESLVPKVDDAQERSKLTSLINAMEKEIVQNVEIKSNRT